MCSLKNKAIASIALCAILLLSSPVRGEQPIRLQEQKIKAGLLYNFMKYSTWPSRAFAQPGDPFQVCLLGGDAFDGALTPLNGRTAQMRPINIRLIDRAGDLGQCHILYVNHDRAGELSEILGAAKNHPVMTISDIEDFASKGGMVEFSQPTGKRISLYLNAEALEREGLRVGGQLLKLAELR